MLDTATESGGKKVEVGEGMSEKVSTESPCAILEDHREHTHRCVRWWQSFSDQHLLNQNRPEPGPDPYGTSVSQNACALSTCHTFSPEALLLLSTLVWFSVHSCSPSPENAWGRPSRGRPSQDRPSQNSDAQPLFRSLTSTVVPKGAGLKAGEQENWNTHQTYKCKVNTQIFLITILNNCKI